MSNKYFFAIACVAQLSCRTSTSSNSSQQRDLQNVNTNASTRSSMIGPLATSTSLSSPLHASNNLLLKSPASTSSLENNSHTLRETWGIDLTFDVQLISQQSNIPYAQFLSAIEVSLTQNRMQMRFQNHVFALPHRSELHSQEATTTSLFIDHSSSPVQHQFISAGALRSWLTEHRNDVLPLANTQIKVKPNGQQLGRITYSHDVSTTYGTLQLEQIDTLRWSKSGMPSARADARVSEPSSMHELGHAGKLLCRKLLELIVSDRVTVGEPCNSDRIPVVAYFRFSSGHGLRLNGSRLEETWGSRVDWFMSPTSAAPELLPVFATTSQRLLNDKTRSLLHTTHSPASLRLINQSLEARVAWLNGQPILWLPAKSEHTLLIQRGSYDLAWRNALGEIIEPNIRIETPSTVMTPHTKKP